MKGDCYNCTKVQHARYTWDFFSNKCVYSWIKLSVEQVIEAESQHLSVTAKIRATNH